MRLQRVFGLVMAVLAALFAAAPANAGAYKNFRAAIYITVDDTKRLADPATFEREFARVSSQLQFDKVYIEAYRDRVFATDAELEAVKHEFQAKGIQTSGGITLAAGGSGGQFGTFDYENPRRPRRMRARGAADRAALRRGDPRRLLLLHLEERRRHRRQGRAQLDRLPARQDARGQPRPGARAGAGRKTRASR